MVERNVVEQMKQRQLYVLTVMERKALLSRLALGEVMVKEPIVVNNVVQYVPVQPGYHARVKALVELNRMEGLYQRGYVPFDPDKPKSVIKLSNGVEIEI